MKDKEKLLDDIRLAAYRLEDTLNAYTKETGRMPNVSAYRYPTLYGKIETKLEITFRVESRNCPSWL